MFIPSREITQEPPRIPKAIPEVISYRKKPGTYAPLLITETGGTIDYTYLVRTCKQGYQWLVINGLKYRLTRNFNRNVEAFKKLHYSTVPLSYPETSKITNPFCFYIKGEKWTYDAVNKDWWVEVIHTTRDSDVKQHTFIRITDYYSLNVRFLMLTTLYKILEPGEDTSLFSVMGDFMFDHFKPLMPITKPKNYTEPLILIYPPLLTPVFIREEDGEYKRLCVSDTVIVDDVSDRDFVFKNWRDGNRLAYQYNDWSNLCI